MKIAILVKLFPSLSETFILNQITGLLDLGHEVEIFSLKKPEQVKQHRDVKKYKLMERVHYIEIPRNKIGQIFKGLYIIAKHFFRKPLVILEFLNLLSYKRKKISLGLLCEIGPFLNKDFDILYCHFGPTGIKGAMIKNTGLIDCKLLTSFHGFDMSTYILKKGKNVYNFLFNIGDAFLPVCDHWKNIMIKLGCSENKIIVHRMGIDLKKFISKEKLLNNTKTRIISIGRLVEKKGIEFVIKAVKNVLGEFPDIDYIIVGDGPLRKKLDNLINKLRIENNVKILGNKTHEEIIELLYDSDILLMPSIVAKDGDCEGIPVVLMEAMATGLPVISTYHSGIPELVKNGKSGFLVPERDIKGIADKLKYLILHYEERLEMGRAGREIIEKEYDIKILNKKLIDIFIKILRG
jgi:colanic acid/amylovoran biosynthesis glycosyltransferase